MLGGLADKIGNRWVFVIGFILMVAALSWLVPASQLWMLYLFAVVFAIAHGGMGAAESPLVAGLFGLRSHGLIYGVIHIGFTFGAAVGPLVTGYIFDITGSYQIAFLICVASRHQTPPTPASSKWAISGQAHRLDTGMD